MRPFYERRIERIAYMPPQMSLSERDFLIKERGYEWYLYVAYKSAVITMSVFRQLEDVARLRWVNSPGSPLLKLSRRSERLKSGMTRFWLEWKVNYSGTYSMDDVRRDMQ